MIIMMASPNPRAIPPPKDPPSNELGFGVVFVGAGCVGVEEGLEFVL